MPVIAPLFGRRNALFQKGTAFWRGLIHFWCKAWGRGPTKLLKLLLDRVCRLVCSDIGAVCGRRRDFDERGQWVGGNWLLGVHQK